MADRPETRVDAGIVCKADIAGRAGHGISPNVNSPLERVIATGPDPSVPRLLWELRAAHPVGASWTLSSRATSRWPQDLLAATLEGGALAAEHQSMDEPGGPGSRLAGPWRRARTLADLVGPDLRVLIVGLNPSLVAADCGVGFAGPTNRFWPAALDAGLVSVDRDPLHAFTHHRVGMTDLVKRATPSARELKAAEFRHGLERLEQTVAWLQPRIVCVVGLTGWRTAHPRSARQRTAQEGLQPDTLGGRPVYLMPNPSGLNAHVTRAGLAERFAVVSSLADDFVPPASTV